MNEWMSEWVSEVSNDMRQEHMANTHAPNMTSDSAETNPLGSSPSWPQECESNQIEHIEHQIVEHFERRRLRYQSVFNTKLSKFGDKRFRSTWSCEAFVNLSRHIILAHCRSASRTHFLKSSRILQQLSTLQNHLLQSSRILQQLITVQSHLRWIHRWKGWIGRHGMHTSVLPRIGSLEGNKHSNTFMLFAFLREAWFTMTSCMIQCKSSWYESGLIWQAVWFNDCNHDRISLANIKAADRLYDWENRPHW